MNDLSNEKSESIENIENNTKKVVRKLKNQMNLKVKI